MAESRRKWGCRAKNMIYTRSHKAQKHSRARSFNPFTSIVSGSGCEAFRSASAAMFDTISPDFVLAAEGDAGSSMHSSRVHPVVCCSNKPIPNLDRAGPEGVGAGGDQTCH